VLVPTSRFTANDMDFTLLNRSTDYGTFAEVQAADPEHHKLTASLPEEACYSGCST
jgi:hypothetical protein